MRGRIPKGAWMPGQSGNLNPKHDAQWKPGQVTNPDGKALTRKKLMAAAITLAHRLPDDLPPELVAIANESLATVYEMMVRPRKYSGIRLSAALALREELCKPRIKQVDVNVDLPGQHAALAYAAISEISGEQGSSAADVELVQSSEPRQVEVRRIPEGVSGDSRISESTADMLRARLDEAPDRIPKPPEPVPPIRRKHRKKVP